MAISIEFYNKLVALEAKMAGKMSGKYSDTSWLTAMIKHHEGALVMAKDAIKNTDNTKIKQLAENIIKTQTEEISLMKSWL